MASGGTTMRVRGKKAAHRRKSQESRMLSSPVERKARLGAEAAQVVVGELDRNHVEEARAEAEPELHDVVGAGLEDHAPDDRAVGVVRAGDEGAQGPVDAQ